MYQYCYISQGSSSYLNMSFGTLLICINFESLDLTIDANFSRDLKSGESEISPSIMV